jgi:hypothetical protein
MGKFDFEVAGDEKCGVGKPKLHDTKPSRSSERSRVPKDLSKKFLEPATDKPSPQKRKKKFSSNNQGISKANPPPNSDSNNSSGDEGTKCKLSC